MLDDEGHAFTAGQLLQLFRRFQCLVVAEVERRDLISQPVLGEMPLSPIL